MPPLFDLDREIYLAPAAPGRAGPACLPPCPPGAPLPPALRPLVAAGPVAVLARQVATPNWELLRFVRLARRLGYSPLVIEHRADRFTAHNPAKRALIVLPVMAGRDRTGRPILRRRRLCDAAAAEGRALGDLTTRWGEGLVPFHHRLLRAVLGPETPALCDLSDLLPQPAAGPAGYYREFFKMLSDRLVLFEDFVACDQTAAFFERVVRPAWRSAVAETGRRPPILRLSPARRAASPAWIAYGPAVLGRLGPAEDTETVPIRPLPLPEAA
ncbi:hypothetical protein [Rubellimicrobium sp. CFH 75288]|uniref:hypothetical protein n=1 Tax=Rubellimicrobium sp. CFH 75288 TaxID=2697034 RepID=UPI0014128F3E|nr:hypothetical protein [Rubellimicrobium sp. CFH 75288]NAZ38152.1 hypothetical protein [Rubellimicrobium sp. CFH 75288]